MLYLFFYYQHHLETCPDAKSVHEYSYTTDEKPLSEHILSLETIIKERKDIDFGGENWDTVSTTLIGIFPIK